MASLFIVHPNLSMTNIDDKSCPNINYYQRVHQKNQQKYSKLEQTYPQQAAAINGHCNTTQKTIQFFQELVENHDSVINTQYLNSPEFKLYRSRFSLEYTLVEYHYLEAYTKILKISKEYFGKAVLTMEDENKGLELISKQMEIFNENEKLLGSLIEIRDSFRKFCSINKLLNDDEIYGDECSGLIASTDHIPESQPSATQSQSFAKRQASVSHIEHSDGYRN